MQIIGLDIGTTSICGILFDCNKKSVIKTINEKNDAWIATEKDFEKIQDPKVILDKVLGILENLYGASEDARAIGISGQMHGILYTDNGGNALSPLYIWQDGRGDLPYKDGKTYAEFLNSHSGYGNVTHFYNKCNGLVPENAAHFCTIHDYAAMKIAGRTAPKVHTSDAASFGLFDMKNTRFLIDDPLLPEVTKETAIIGEWNGIPVAVAIGDNQASFLGCGAGDGAVLVNIGTGAQVSFVTDYSAAVNGLEIRPLHDDSCIAVGSSLCGGRAYALLENFFKGVAAMAGVAVDNLYDKMGETANKNTDMEFETLFSGTRENPKKRASITNISIDNFTPGDMTYACLKGIAKELYDLCPKDVNCDRLIGAGNGIRKNAVLKEILEEMFEAKMYVPTHTEEAAVGAALFAMTGAGICKNIKEAEDFIRYED